MTAAGTDSEVYLAVPVQDARALAVGQTAASVQVSGLPERIIGWSFREVTGAAPADIQLIDGLSNNGQIIAEITLGPGESIRDVAGGWCLRARVGVFLQVNSGTVRGSVWSAIR